LSRFNVGEAAVDLRRRRLLTQVAIKATTNKVFDKKSES
jgi:hypothetical protein